MPGTGCWTPQRMLAHGGHTGQHWDWWAHLSEEVRVRRVREVLVGDVGKLGSSLSPGCFIGHRQKILSIYVLAMD